MTREVECSSSIGSSSFEEETPPCVYCEHSREHEQTITVEARYTPESPAWFDSGFGNWLPGDPADFDWDSSTFKIDGEKATPEQVEEIESDARLMLKFEEEARFNNV